MKRVLIADDEVRIVRLLKTMIDWESLSLELVGVANNGVEALEKVKALQVDILLADIQMPGMDGLELTALGMAHNPNLAVIVISGYKEFDYAYKAIKQGVADYLIKPVNKYDLDKSLRRILNMQQVDNVMLKEELLKFRREQLMLNYIHGINTGSKSLQMLNDENDMNFRQGLFAVVMTNLFCDDESVVLDPILERVGRFIMDELSAYCMDLEYVTIYKSCYCLLNFQADSAQEVLYAIKNMKQALKARFEDPMNLTLTLGVSRQVGEHGLIHEICGQARLACKSGCFLGRQKPIFAESMAITPSGQMMTMTQSTAFLNAIVQFEPASMEQTIRELLETHHDLLLEKPWMVEQLLFELLAVFNQELTKAQVALESGQEEELVAHLLGSQTLQSLPNALTGWMEQKLEAYAASKESPYRDSITLARRYIDDNFTQQISLTDICEQVGFSYHYFSSLYKQETGEPISDYITQARINHAKTLLTTTTLNLKTVANQSGYVDMKHFNKTFQKKVGIRPMEYRKLRS